MGKLVTSFLENTRFVTSDSCFEMMKPVKVKHPPVTESMVAFFLLFCTC